jgi:hypothetical protein
MTAALISGTVGVLLGGFINWRVQLALTNRQQRAQTRAGLKLIQEELKRALARLRSALDTGTLWTAIGLHMSLGRWRTVEDVLALTLPNDLWDTIANAYGDLEDVDLVAREYAARDEDWTGFKVHMANAADVVESALLSVDRTRNALDHVPEWKARLRDYWRQSGQL